MIREYLDSRVVVRVVEEVEDVSDVADEVILMYSNSSLPLQRLMEHTFVQPCF
jgi:hypothetical protein